MAYESNVGTVCCISGKGKLGWIKACTVSFWLMLLLSSYFPCVSTFLGTRLITCDIPVCLGRASLTISHLACKLHGCLIWDESARAVCRHWAGRIRQGPLCLGYNFTTFDSKQHSDLSKSLFKWSFIIPLSTTTVKNCDHIEEAKPQLIPTLTWHMSMMLSS